MNFLSRKVYLEQNQIENWARVLDQARVNAQPIPQLTQTLKDFSRSDAYSIQEHQFKLRESRGEKQIGWKMGLTSEAKRRQMNLDSPLYGFLTDRMLIPNQGALSLASKIHPKIEPEVAFWIKRDLSGAVTRNDVLNGCAGVAACMEILDSRYNQFKYFSMEDVISDNSSSCAFVLGPWREDFQALDLSALQLEMFVNGTLAQKGISRDISGDPVTSVIQLCALLAERGQILKSGSIVLAGAATAAVELTPGLDVALKVDGLGPVAITVQKTDERPR